MERYLFIAYQGGGVTVHDFPSRAKAILAWSAWALAESSTEAKLFRLPEGTGQATCIATCGDGEIGVTDEAPPC